MLNLSFLDKLDDQQKQWMTIAFAGMSVADGVIDKRELNDLGVVLTYMGDIDKAEGLMQMLKAKQIPHLPQIEVKDRSLAVKMLFAIAKVGAVDNILSPKETEYLIYAGAVLNFPKDYVQNVLRWAKQHAELNRFQGEIIKQGNTLDLNDTSLVGEYVRKTDAQALDF